MNQQNNQNTYTELCTAIEFDNPSIRQIEGRYFGAKPSDNPGQYILSLFKEGDNPQMKTLHRGSAKECIIVVMSYTSGCINGHAAAQAKQ